MISQINNNLEPKSIFEKPEIKWGGTVLAVIAVAGGVFGIAYGICGFTQIAQSSHFFYPLTQGLSQKIAVIVIGGVVGAGGIIIIILIHNHTQKVTHKSDPVTRQANTPNQAGTQAVQGAPEPNNTQINRETENLISNIDTAFASLDTVRAKVKDKRVRQCIDQVESFLLRGYQSKKDYFSFYYYLASISEVVLKNKKLQSNWREFLDAIHGSTVYRQDKNHQMQIDCAREISRLNGDKVDLVVEEIPCAPAQVGSVHDSAQDEVIQIMCDAFDDFKDTDAGRLKWNFFTSGPHQNVRFFAVKPKTKQEIFGCIALIERRRGELLVCNLARKPAEVKLGLTEKFKQHLEKLIQEGKYQHITCDVDTTNLHAIDIYSKLGFRKTGKGYQEDGRTFMYMRYNPTGQHAEGLEVAV